MAIVYYENCKVSFEAQSTDDRTGWLLAQLWDNDQYLGDNKDKSVVIWDIRATCQCWAGFNPLAGLRLRGSNPIAWVQPLYTDGPINTYLIRIARTYHRHQPRHPWWCNASSSSPRVGGLERHPV